MRTVERSLVLSLLALAALLSLSAAPARAQTGVPAPQSSDVKVTVLPFEVNAGPELAYLEASLPQLLADKLAEMGFQVTSQDEVRGVILDRGFEYLDLQTSRDIALLTGAGWAVYGSFSQVGEAISIDARLVEAFGLKPVKAVFVTRQGLISVLPAVEELAEKLRNELQRKEVVAEIAVEGVNALSEDVVLSRLVLQVGDLYDARKVNEDLRRVFELGYFDDVKVLAEDAPQGRRIVFQVVEKPRIGAINVEGSEELDADDIREAMATKPGSVLNLKVLADDLNKIRELYRKDGYYNATVDYKLEDPSARQTQLDLVIHEGRKLYIKDIVIEGAKEIPADDLKSELALGERGMFSWVTGSGVLKEELLERDAAVMEAYYANRGFIEAKVGAPRVEFQEDGIQVVYSVSEGPRYKPGKVTFSGDLIETEEALLQVTKVDELARDGEYLDRSVVQRDVQKLTDHYTNFGYAFAEANVDINPQPGEHIVDINYRLSKGAKVYIRRILLEGNTKTRDNVILREMRLTDGDQFSGKLLSRSVERLNKLDFFAEADIEPLPTGSPDTLDLKVKVKEKPTGMISAGAGYSSYSKVFFTGTVQERNLFGRGYNLGFTGKFSGRGNTYMLNFTNPSVNDTKLGMGFDTYVMDQDLDDYDKDTIGGRARFSYPLGEYSRLYFGYRLDRYTISDVEDDAAEIIKDYEGINWSSVASGTFRRDTTNKPINPDRGTIFDLSLEYGGGALLGDDDFIKLVEAFDWFQGLWWETIFHWHVEVGAVLKNMTDDEVPPFERFYLGGLNSVRGYEGRRISPRDSESGDRIGGNKEFFTNLEYIFPIKKDLGLNGVVFFDAGNAWDNDEWIFGSTNSAVEQPFLGLYKSVGLGVRWASPIGPLRLEYGFPLDEIEGSDRTGRFEFSIGSVF